MMQWDVYLNGLGFMLAKTPDGRLLSGAIRDQRSDPFMRYVQENERWKRASFYFDQGAGAGRVDGSHRYRRGWRIDSRGGKLIRAPQVTVHQAESGLLVRSEPDTNIYDRELSDRVGADKWEGMGVLFTVPSGKTQMRGAAVMLKREAGVDYGAAANANFDLRLDSAGTPGAIKGTVAFPMKSLEKDWPILTVTDPWEGEDYHYHYLYLTAAETVTAASDYWLCIRNDQSYRLYWAQNEDDATATVSEYNGSTWAAGVGSSDRPFYKINFVGDVDGPVRCFCEFRGSDNEKRLYAAVGTSVMYWTAGTSRWTTSMSTFTSDVRALIVFNSRLFAGQGPDNDMYSSTGATGSTVWSAVTGQQASAFAIHDSLLWKADGASVNGSSTGTAWTGAAVDVGDPGTPVSAMCSHGGSLFVFKQEGVFELSYPDTYPSTGTPTANLVIDLHTEMVGRRWALDWHSGLYFAGYNGVYEWKNGVLRDIWSERLDDDLPEVAEKPGVWTRPNRTAPVSGTGPKGVPQFRAACGTTRGLVVACDSPHRTLSGLWWYDGRWWHPLWQIPDYEMEYITAVIVQAYGAGRGRVVFAKGHDMASFVMPTWTVDNTEDPYAGYDTEDGQVELPLFDDDLPHMIKDFHAVGVKLQNASVANGTVKVYYLLDAEDATSDDPSDWSYLGQVTTSGYQELAFGSNTWGRTIRLLLVMQATGTTSTVEVEHVDLLFQPRPDTIKQYQVVIRAAENLPLHGGGHDTQSAADIIGKLQGLLEVAEPFVFIDELGASHTVMALGVTKLPSRHIQSGGVRPSIEAQVVVTMLDVETRHEQEGEWQLPS